MGERDNREKGRRDVDEIKYIHTMQRDTMPSSESQNRQ